MVSQEEFVSPTRTRTLASPADPLPLNESAGLPGRLPAGLILRLKTQMEVSQTAAEPGALTDLCLRYRREPIEAVSPLFRYGENSGDPAHFSPKQSSKNVSR